eukprot:10401138-Lingulodinium_polyedra.AAC.1
MLVLHFHPPTALDHLHLCQHVLTRDARAAPRPMQELRVHCQLRQPLLLQVPRRGGNVVVVLL